MLSLQEKPSPVLLSRRYANTGLLSSATCTPPRTTPTPPPPIPRAPAAPCTTAPPRPAPVPCPARPALLLSSAPSPPSSATRQCPPVLVLRYCPRPPRRHLASRNTKGTGARPQPRTTPPPRPAPAPGPCPATPPSRASAPPCAAAAMPAPLSPAIAQSSARARAHVQHHATATPPHAAPRLRPAVPCQCPNMRRCSLARPVVTCNRANAPPCAARPIINLQQGKARSTERQPGGECARKQV